MANARRKSEKEQAAPETATVLVADDDPSVRALLIDFLGDEGYAVVEAATGMEALQRMTDDPAPDLVLLDVRLPDLGGIEILQKMLEQGIEVPVIVMTGYTSASLAIRAIQMGAEEYITKPLDLDVVEETIKRVVRNKKMQHEPEVSMPKPDPTERMVGSSPQMIDVFKQIGRVARTPTTVLVTGDSGTGKELVAEAIHQASDRRSGPMIKVNCAALPETLLESELFGHEKGSFTGALAQHKGRFEAANKGTIFLDEIGEMTLGTQSKLLRVLQEREFERVGGTVPVKVDVRVIAATNRNLSEEVLAGRFREDLFFRLNVIGLHMPPLRDRREDIPALVSHFLNKHRYSPTAMPARISQEAVDVLMAHNWPGNVRELENIIQRAVVLSRGDLITPEHIVFQNELNRYVLDVEQKVRARVPLEQMLREVRVQAVATAMRLNEYDEHKAAEQLGISEDDVRQYYSVVKDTTFAPIPS